MKRKVPPAVATLALLTAALTSCNQAASPQNQVAQAPATDIGQDIVSKETVAVWPKNFSAQAVNNSALKSLFNAGQKR